MTCNVTPEEARTILFMKNMHTIGDADQRGIFGDFARLLEQLPHYQDPAVLILLKGHLLVEELLHVYIQRNVPNPVAIRHGELSFAKCLMLCQALSPPETHSWAFQAAAKLNSVRNEVVHELESTKLQEMLETFVKVVEQSAKDSVFPPAERGEARLYMAVTDLYHELSNQLHVRKY